MQKLAIVGSHPDTRVLAPYDDPGFDIWVFNEAAQSPWCKRWTACFQLHREELYTSPHNMSNKGHWAWLQQEHGKPIYMQEVDPRVPDSVRYPGEDVSALVPEGFRTFTSTTSFALALAMYQGYDEIHIYGVELGSNTEYMYQAENWRFWVGVALGRGINLNLHSGVRLFTGPWYGYEGDLKIGLEYFTERAGRYEAEFNAADKSLKNMKGSLERAADRQEFEKMFRLIIEARDAAQLAGEKSGRLSQAEGYAKRGDTIISRQDFERSVASAQIEGEKHKTLGIHSGGMVEVAFNIWKGTKTRPAMDYLMTTLQKHLQHAFDTGAYFGIYAENMEYIAEYDKRYEASGGEKSLQVITANQMSEAVL